MGVGKAVFWYFWVAALATGKKRRKRDGGGEYFDEEDQFDQFWNQNVQTGKSKKIPVLTIY